MNGNFGMQNKLCAIQDSFLSTFINANATHVLLRMFCYRSPDSKVYFVLHLTQEHDPPAALIPSPDMHKSLIVMVINWGTIVCKLFILLMVIASSSS